MAKRGKNYKKALESIEKGKTYTAEEAIKLVKETSYTKFDSSVQVAYNLSVDPKQADQNIRGALVLPNGTGKTKKVIVFATGDQAREAEAAGADEVGDDDLLQKVKDGYMDFDVVVATPQMMAKVGQLGKILGPRGLMPNPKTGTVTADVKKAVENVKAGQVNYRVDRQGIISVPIGKVSFDADKLSENFKALNEAILRAKPSSAKGIYMKSVSVHSTMGPGIKVDASTI
ncbi:50S ribosomal protein L1 [Xylocopilactobacillus apicola]|uniref:Large ribosomal subunit protein uL1 n=1 Tax=Xylocopilactobacillus apicola TaxID=2932184 RepID=A0AAU9D9B8_9LACO|nr:50S ribosomal protein L1 [Xylocopilactobacillus apicola]BDR59006.1 50S ribosomal protein L1 [Xylocopilactobacillus apicola]